MTTRGGHSHPRQNDGLRVPVAAVECRRESSAWRSSLRTRPCEPPRAVQASAGAIGVVMARRSVLSVAATTSSRVRAVGRASPPSRCARGEKSVACRIGFDAYPSQRWWKCRSFSRSWRCRMASIGRATNDVSVAPRRRTRRRTSVAGRHQEPCHGRPWSAVRQWRFVSWLLQVRRCSPAKESLERCRGPLPRSGMVHHHHQQRRLALRHLRLPEIL